MPKVILRNRQWKIIHVPETTIVRRDGSPIICHGSVKTSSYIICVVRREHLVFECARTKVIVSFNAARIFELSRSFDVGNFRLNVFKIVPHDKRSVVLIRPSTDFNCGKLCRFKRPFDGFAEDVVRIHPRTITAIRQEWLHRRVINEIAFSIGFIRQIRACITHGHNGCVA